MQVICEGMCKSNSIDFIVNEIFEAACEVMDDLLGVRPCWPNLI